MIGEAYCNKCASLAGDNGYECDRCAALPHANPEREEDEGETLFYCKCPFCGFRDLVSVPGNLEMCGKCSEEYVSVDPDEIL